MELDELKDRWSRHEELLMESTALNREMLKISLIRYARKSIDWLKLRTLAGLILPLIGILFIVLPRIRFIPEFDVIVGLVLFGSITLLTYFWAVRVYLLMEKVDFEDPILEVSLQARRVEKYKLKVTRYGFILAPFMVAGVFLSAGIPFLSVKMIPFYALMVISFLIGQYVRSRHGVAARMRKIEKEIQEILKLEA